MSIPMNVLQSLMAINAQAIHSVQEVIEGYKLIRSKAESGECLYFDVSECNECIRKAKHRMSLLERNQRALKHELDAVIFQAHVDKLTNVEYNDDLIYH